MTKTHQTLSSWIKNLCSLKKTQKKTLIPDPEPHYDLEELLQEVNETYFENSLSIPIGWSGKGKTSSLTSIRLGYYHCKKKVIKINRLLDHPEVDKKLLLFVIYHEALHHLFPPIEQPGSRRKIHHAEFLKKEQEFHHYEEAQLLLKTLKTKLFSHSHLYRKSRRSLCQKR